MKLFGTGGSPYVRKVRIAFAEKNIPYEYVLAPPEQRAALVAPLNPLGKIPTLLASDGQAIYDSVVIVEYLDGLQAEPKLIPAQFAERIAVKRWEALGDGVAEATVLLTHDPRKAEAKRESPAWYEKQRQKIQRALTVMEQQLGDQEYCFGSQFSLADIATGYSIGYLEQGLPDFEWRSANPRLAKHIDKLNQRESFKSTMVSKS